MENDEAGGGIWNGFQGLDLDLDFGLLYGGDLKMVFHLWLNSVMDWFGLWVR